MKKALFWKNVETPGTLHVDKRGAALRIYAVKMLRK